jgi:hypothetical protein
VNAENFAEWLRRQGFLVVKTPSSYWYEASPRVFQAFPYHWVIHPKNEELSTFLWRNRAVALRYSTSIDNPVGCISYHAVYEEASYTIDSLDRRSRQNVRTGLKNCRVEAISVGRLAEEGWALEEDTANRQGRRLSVDKAAWERRYRAAADIPGFEAWGAFVDRRFVASLLSFRMEDCCELISQQCHRDFLNARVNNALSFVVTDEMVKRGGIRSIFYTLQSLDAPPNVDEFKFRMGYTAKPLRQRVVVHPLIRAFVNRSLHQILLKLLRRDPQNPKLAKAEGMVRFYLQGNQSLSEQDWPECVAPFKESYINAQVSFEGA